MDNSYKFYDDVIQKVLIKFNPANFSSIDESSYIVDAKGIAEKNNKDSPLRLSKKVKEVIELNNSVIVPKNICRKIAYEFMLKMIFILNI